MSVYEARKEFLLVKHAIRKQIEPVTVKLTCGNENQDNKYVVQTTMRHHSFDEVSFIMEDAYLLSVISKITEKRKSPGYFAES